MSCDVDSARKSPKIDSGRKPPKTDPMLAMNLGPLSCFCLKSAHKARNEDVIHTSSFTSPYLARDAFTEEQEGPDLTRDHGAGALALLKVEDRPAEGRSGLAGLQAPLSPRVPGEGCSRSALPPKNVPPSATKKKKDMFEAGSSLLGALVGGVDALVHPDRHETHCARGLHAHVEESWPHAIVPDLLSGKTLQASRKLAEMRDGPEFPEVMLRQADIERIGRVSDLFYRSNRPVQAPAHTWRDHAREIEGSLHVSDGVLRVESSAVIRGFEVVQALASLCELDCSFQPTNRVIGEASPFQPIGPEVEQRADESFWRVVRDAERTDDVVEVTCVNALEEKSNPMIWLSSRQVSTETGFYHSSVDIPPTQIGYRRASTEPTQYRITWSEADDDASAGGASHHSGSFRLHVVRTRKLSQASSMLHSVLPCCCLMGSARTDVAAFFDGFKENLRNYGAMLDERIATGTRSSFYAQARKSAKAHARAAA